MKVIVVVGPTAVGKTALSIAIAKAIAGEIVSGDSRQVYTGLDIGTGKVTREEMHGVPHHLIDVIDPTQIFTASDYVGLGRATIEDISERGHTPVIVGGTGFYIDALLGRMSLADVGPDEALREELARLNLAELQEKLKELDPERYETIDIKNRRRLERAIEVVEAPAVRRESGPAARPEHGGGTEEYNVLWLGLSLPIPELRERIRVRLLARLDAGMLDEATRLHTQGLSYERMEDIGLEYRYMARHLQGQITYDEMVAELEKEIVKYAKRQMTWFKKNKEIAWFEPGQKDETLGAVRSFINGP